MGCAAESCAKLFSAVKNNAVQCSAVQCSVGRCDGQQRLSMIIWKDDFPNGRLANMETKWLQNQRCEKRRKIKHGGDLKRFKFSKLDLKNLNPEFLSEVKRRFENQELLEIKDVEYIWI